MVSLLKRLLRTVARQDSSSAQPGAAAPVSQPTASQKPHDFDARLEAAVTQALDRLGAEIQQSRAARLAEALRLLREADPSGPQGPLVVAECSLRDLEEVAPGHPLLSVARATVAEFTQKYATAIPELRDIGRLDNVCPTCTAALPKRPQRKTKCHRCGASIYVRTRPIDGARVLLNESELHELDVDWQADFKLKQRQPRTVSPEWAARIAEAREAGPSPDGAVEAKAQRLFAELRSACLTEAPRDAMDRLLSAIDEPEFRSKVAARVWQLQVQSIDGVAARGTP